MKINVYRPIGQKDFWFSFFENQEMFFSFEDLKDNVEASNDNEIILNINCDGGEIYEGLTIYDYLRTCGKEVFCNIEGNCHSMAVTILLAAPKENRTANKHARALIHRAAICEICNADTGQLEELTKEVRELEEKILAIYAERTGQPIETMRELMYQQKINTAETLLQLGFISSINNYTNNQFFNKMNFKERLNKILAPKNEVVAVNYDHKDAEGNVLFSTEKETDELEVGDAVTIASGETSGTFELSDGRTVVVVDNVITEISEPEDDSIDLGELQNKVDKLTLLVNELIKSNEAKDVEISNLKKNVVSNAVKSKRTPQVANKSEKTKTVEEIKNEVYNKLKK